MVATKVKLRAGHAPTVDQLTRDKITQIAVSYWAPYTKDHSKFDPNIIVDLYQKELIGSAFSTHRIVLLEFSQYLECYLWPNYNANTASLEHVMSIICMVNEKQRERVPIWNCFQRSPKEFPGFFRRVLELALDLQNSLTLLEQSCVITFLVHCFNSLEVDLIRQHTAPLYSFHIWDNLLPSQRNQLLRKGPKSLQKLFKKLKQHDTKMTPAEKEQSLYDRIFFVKLIEKFISILESLPAEGDINMANVHYCERFLELLIDMESVLHIRRTFNALLHSMHVVTHCKMAKLCQREEGSLFVELLRMLQFFARFEVDELTGTPITESESLKMHYTQVTDLQKAAFKHYNEEMRDFYLLNVSAIDSRRSLFKHFEKLKKNQLYNLAEFLYLVPSDEDGDEKKKMAMHTIPRPFLEDLLVGIHEKRPSQLQALNEMPIYPTEDIIWDENMIPYETYHGNKVLALNKLNLQFLTLQDYLLRNFHLFRMESTYELRGDLEDAILRMKPWAHESDETKVVWGGWARMALPIVDFSVVEVAKPRIGEKAPSVVRADVAIALPKRGDIKEEWEQLRQHDVCFLVTVRPDAPSGHIYDARDQFKGQVPIIHVRGCEIDGMLGPDGKVIQEMGPLEPKPIIDGDLRTFRVWLDTNQYYQDMAHMVDGYEDPYQSFNLIIRRNPKTNNFKAVLDTIRSLMNVECVVPDWLHDTILGYGDPADAHYSRMLNRIATLNFNDTFIDSDHVKESFPDAEVRWHSSDGYPLTDRDEVPQPPFRVTFSNLATCADDKSTDDSTPETIVVQPVVQASRGPYPYSEPRRNQIRFTPTQIEAIKSGMQPGLTMVVGPPGTGKTDVATQIIANIYHNWPEQRTLIVTHSNQALNQIFEKIMVLDVDERHLLRLGHGEEALETDKDFTRYGRVNYVLGQRLSLLQEVERLQKSLHVPGDLSYTCETSMHFFLYQVQARWEVFDKTIIQPNEGHEKSTDPSIIAQYFPFTEYFANAPQPLFKGLTYAEDLEIANGCWRFIRRIFEQLDEFRAFELLRSGRDRTEYLLVKEAKIIAMTCTHSALRRDFLVELGFRYDNILMEESAQILEIETFIPLLLQNPKDGHNRLKRWIMIGDHHQLPPVIQNPAFEKYSNMEQSLFTRFIRLGVPAIQLDRQGRARSSIAQLYNWRYKNLGNLPHIDALPQFRRANAGFVLDYQLINVEDFNGVGESTPSPYFFQNLAEAEYAAAIFMYMRLLGYPQEKISILTTYNGQKHLIRDVVEKRCGANPIIGRPHKIETVDKYQGQQNDYIILSLVRTRHVGHIRDVRRLVVALSRARLGLYVLARVSLFKNCFELTPAFNQLCKRPQKLALVPNEHYPTDRLLISAAGAGEAVQINDMTQMAQMVYQLYKHTVSGMQAVYQQQLTQQMEQKIDEDIQELDKDTGKVLDKPAEEDNEQETIKKQTDKDGGNDIDFEPLNDDDD